MKRFRKNDVAIMVAGEDAGKTGRILRILPSKNQIVVEGVNLVYKHVRRSQQNPQGGRIQKEAPIHISNVMPYCDKCEKGVKVRYEVKDGQKRRACKSCGAVLYQ